MVNANTDCLHVVTLPRNIPITVYFLSAANSCLLPSATTHIVTDVGTATLIAAGTSGTLSCATGYTGTITAPACTAQGNTWTYTGSCFGELT